MSTALHNLSDYDLTSVPDASNMCFGIVVSEWNPEVTGALLDGAVRTLEKHGAITRKHSCEDRSRQFLNWFMVPTR